MPFSESSPLIQAKKIYAVGSGKGGVGKSTVSVNLAVALAGLGLKVGLLDADVYGPSVPIMMGLRRLSPRLKEDQEGQEKVIPITKFGVKVISLGFFIEEARSVLWRGPMMHGTLQKMLQSVDWGELDILIIDLPPGTGDVQISLSQLLKINGALVVSTPQEVAMLDAIKAINAFQQLQIPLLGVIENMAGFKAPGSQETHHIFGQGKALELAQRFDIPLLGSLPLIPAIRLGSDEGIPAAFHQGETESSSCFRDLAAKFLELTMTTNRI